MSKMIPGELGSEIGSVDLHFHDESSPANLLQTVQLEV